MNAIIVQYFMWNELKFPLVHGLNLCSYRRPVHGWNRSGVFSWTRSGTGIDRSECLSSSSSATRAYSTTDDDPLSASGLSLEQALAKQWNVKGLKQEVTRRHQRIFKKLGKAYEKLAAADAKYAEVSSNVNASLEELEQCPNPELCHVEIAELKAQLESVTLLDERLKDIKASTDARFREVLNIVVRLNLSDEPPSKQERGTKKVKQTPSGPREPFFAYRSLDGIEIRVGRSSEDNDQLSCNPKYRDSNNWWMHAAGCPGSHVVIRTDTDDLIEMHKQTVMDAALLAAVNSKAKQSGKVQVSLTRCRNVSKPVNAKAGLVHLSGEVLTVSVDLRQELSRLDRLQKVA